MARIPEAEVERLKHEVSVARLVMSAGIELRKSGKDQIGKCPFHDDAEPSLVVTAAKNLWHCFGCQVGGGPMTCDGVRSFIIVRQEEIPTQTLVSDLAFCLAIWN